MREQGTSVSDPILYAWQRTDLVLITEVPIADWRQIDNSYTRTIPIRLWLFCYWIMNNHRVTIIYSFFIVFVFSVFIIIKVFSVFIVFMFCVFICFMSGSESCVMGAHGTNPAIYKRRQYRVYGNYMFVYVSYMKYMYNGATVFFFFFCFFLFFFPFSSFSSFFFFCILLLYLLQTFFLLSSSLLSFFLFFSFFSFLSFPQLFYSSEQSLTLKNVRSCYFTRIRHKVQKQERD